MRLLYVVGWAWIIIVGGLMITPGGVQCIACGRFNLPVAIISILVGVAGLVATFRAQPAIAAR